MGVEIAVRTFPDTPGKVNVQAERDVRGCIVHAGSAPAVSVPGPGD